LFFSPSSSKIKSTQTIWAFRKDGTSDIGFWAEFEAVLQCLRYDSNSDCGERDRACARRRHLKLSGARRVMFTLAQAKIKTAQWQAVKIIEPVKVRTVAVEPAAGERFDVVFYGGGDRLQFERRWIRWVDQTRDEIAGGLYAGARLGALSPPPQGRRSSREQG
jgi:hypothetical protein